QWTLWDPLDEVAQRQLMRLLAYDGRVSEALAAYEKCRHLLQTELDIPPAPATTTLYKTIRDGSLSLPNISPVPLHNLPRALSPFYGRKKEIKELTSHLLNPHYPLVSVTGLGGIGKTSLALAAGRELLATGQPPFKDGIWFISLEEIENDTPEKVRDKIAALVGQAMGLHFHSESALWSQLLGQLAPKKTLLILDNIEQFFTAASDLIVQLLEAGDNIHLLVTSRTALALAASVTLPLTGLETPAQASVEALQNESVRLFAERAARMPTPFHLEKHLAEVVAICQFVEGMPLGIELAAASLGWLMVDEIMPALTNNLRLLNANRRDLPPRQRTLHAVFDYTWQLLTPLEQTLLVQISIFRGGFTRRAAEAILNDAGSGLFNLQHHALLGRDETGRFKMHPLLRQLACEKLSDSDTAVAELTLHRHSAYFSAFMGAFAKELQCGEGQEALQTIFPEQANLRAAWQYAVQAGKWQTIANCLDGYHFFYKRKGFYTEEMTLIDGAIAALQATMTADNVSLTCLLSRLLAVQAWDYLYSAQLEKGAETAERACKMAQGLENVNLAAQARLVWARLLYRQSKHDSALAQYEQVVSLAKIAQNPILEADGWIGIGGQIAWQADVEPAREPLRYALNLCQSLQYKPGEMQTLTWLGILAMRQEAFAESEQFYKRALWLSRRLGETPAEAELLGNLGVVARYRDDLVGSQSYQEEALTVFRQLNMPGSEQWLLGELGLTATQLGDYAIAEQNLTDALEIARQIKDVFWQAWVKSRLGTIWNERGELDKALSFLTEAFATAEQLQNPRLQGMVLYDWGNVCLNQTDWVQAEQKFQKAYDLWHGLGQTQLAMPSLAGLAFATYRQKKLEIAADHAESLWQTWQESPKLAERAYLKLYWMLGLVWDGLGDDRANHLWEKAHALLQRRSEKIADEGARRIFLERAPAHRAILHRV
ncbi:MAG: tetratricopeptide repeat protein, partial [Chloroflexi bacterium]|nr:tetratricopeptide repeat protein [Chloroflexota bacterium]